MVSTSRRHSGSPRTRSERDAAPQKRHHRDSDAVWGVDADPIRAPMLHPCEHATPGCLLCIREPRLALLSELNGLSARHESRIPWVAVLGQQRLDRSADAHREGAGPAKAGPARRLASTVRSNPQVGLPDLGIVRQCGGGPAQRHAAVLQDVASVGDFEGEQHILFDEEHGGPLLADVA